MARKRTKKDQTSELSRRELMVLRHLSNGESTADIAKQLVRRAVKKLKAKNRLHAVAIALRKRLI